MVFALPRSQRLSIPRKNYCYPLEAYQERDSTPKTWCLKKRQRGMLNKPVPKVNQDIYFQPIAWYFNTLLSLAIPVTRHNSSNVGMTLCCDNYLKFTAGACHKHIRKVFSPPNTPNQVIINLEPELKKYGTLKTQYSKRGQREILHEPVLKLNQ